MEFKKFFAGPDDGGRRLDRILRRLLMTENLSGIYQSMRKGLIKLNGAKAKPDSRVFQGDCITVASFLLSGMVPGSDLAAAGSVPVCFETVFRNKSVLIINKPYDRPVQGPASLAEDIVLLWKKEHDGSETDASLSFVPGPLHRLDRKTTGALVFSQSLSGAQWISKAFASHRIGKKYIAVVQGVLPSSERWTDMIQKDETDPDDASFHTVSVSESGAGREALTEAAPLAYGTYNKEPVTLAEFSIATGRTHQIRLQSSFHGYPLLGDTAYGGKAIHEDRDFYLHAYRLDIPADNPLAVPAEITASISTEFVNLLNKTLIKWDGSLIL